MKEIDPCQPSEDTCWHVTSLMPQTKLPLVASSWCQVPPWYWATCHQCGVSRYPRPCAQARRGSGGGDGGLLNRKRLTEHSGFLQLSYFFYSPGSQHRSGETMALRAEGRVGSVFQCCRKMAWSAAIPTGAWGPRPAGVHTANTSVPGSRLTSRGPKALSQDRAWASVLALVITDPKPEGIMRTLLLLVAGVVGITLTCIPISKRPKTCSSPPPPQWTLTLAAPAPGEREASTEHPVKVWVKVLGLSDLSPDLLGRMVGVILIATGLSSCWPLKKPIRPLTGWYLAMRSLVRSLSVFSFETPSLSNLTQSFWKGSCMGHPREGTQFPFTVTLCWSTFVLFMVAFSMSRNLSVKAWIVSQPDWPDFMRRLNWVQ